MTKSCWAPEDGVCGRLPVHFEIMRAMSLTGRHTHWEMEWGMISGEVALTNEINNHSIPNSIPLPQNLTLLEGQHNNSPTHCWRPLTVNIILDIAKPRVLPKLFIAIMPSTWSEECVFPVRMHDWEWGRQTCTLSLTRQSERGCSAWTQPHTYLYWPSWVKEQLTHLFQGLGIHLLYT